MTPRNVRSRRIALGLTVPELATAFGVSPSLLDEFERGRTQLPNAEQYQPILDRLEHDQLTRTSSDGRTS